MFYQFVACICIALGSYAHAAAPTQPAPMLTPDTCPKVSGWADPYVTADFIYWKAQVNNADFAFNGVGDTASDANAPKGHFYHPSFSYEPGFKVGLGVKFHHDGWDLFSQYTWLRVNDDQTRKSATPLSTPDSLRPTIAYIPFSVSAAPTLLKITGAWDLDFNVLDLLLGREFWISPRLSLKPFTGMKLSWNEQEFTVSSHSNVSSNYLRYIMKIKQMGVGLTGGLNTSYYMWNKWSIYGNLAVSGMFNSISTARKNTFTNDSVSNVLDINSHGSNNDVTAIVESGLGLRFETCFSRYKWLLEAGWETQLWFDQAVFMLMNNAPPGNLSMQGLTIRSGFWF